MRSTSASRSDLTEVQWAPVDGSGELASAPGLKTIDPYDLIIVLAGENSLPPLTDSERTAYKVHKMAYDVALEVPPFRVIGTVYLFPGSEPDRLLDRATEMFIPLVDATAYADGKPLTEENVDAVLVNRFYLRGRRADRPPHRDEGADPARRPAGRHELAGPLPLDTVAGLGDAG